MTIDANKLTWPDVREALLTIGSAGTLRILQQSIGEPSPLPDAIEQAAHATVLAWERRHHYPPWQHSLTKAQKRQGRAVLAYLNR
jgi:hypothetical protein